jgi:hypothetical protein
MGTAFERIVIVMLENATRSSVLENSYMNGLRRKGVFLANSYGVTHSSQPNYIASLGGDTFGIFNDTPGYVQWVYETYDENNQPAEPQPPPVTCIVDLLEARGLTWRAYAEDIQPENVQATGLFPPYPPPPPDNFPFARKHVPFLSFPVVTSSPERLKCIADAKQFERDLRAGELPAYGWYTPNLINDGHSLSTGERARDPEDSNRRVNVDNIAAFLDGFLSADPVAKFPPETLIAITFDEAYPYYSDYAVYTLLIGDMLEAGTVRTEPYNHYSLLRSVEENFGLGSLRRNDAAAAPYWFLR